MLQTIQLELKNTQLSNQLSVQSLEQLNQKIDKLADTIDNLIKGDVSGSEQVLADKAIVSKVPVDKETAIDVSKSNNTKTCKTDDKKVASKLDTYFSDTSLPNADDKKPEKGVKIIWYGKEAGFRSLAEAARITGVSWSVLRNRKVNGVIDLDTYPADGHVLPKNVDSSRVYQRTKGMQYGGKKVSKEVQLVEDGKMLEAFPSVADFRKRFNLAANIFYDLANTSHDKVEFSDLQDYNRKRRNPITLKVNQQVGE